MTKTKGSSMLLLALLLLLCGGALAQEEPQMALESGQHTVYIGHGNRIYTTKSSAPLCDVAASGLLYADDVRLVFAAQGALMEISLTAESGEPKTIDEMAVGGVYVPQDGLVYYISASDDSNLRGYSPVQGAHRDVKALAHEIGAMSATLDGLLLEAAGGNLLYVPQTGEFVDAPGYAQGVTAEPHDSFETLLDADGNLRLRGRDQSAGESIAVDGDVLAATALNGMTYYLKRGADATALYDFSYATGAKAGIGKFKSALKSDLTAAGGTVYALGADGTVYAMNADSHAVRVFGELSPLPADPILVATSEQLLVYSAVTSRDLKFVQALPVEDDALPVIEPTAPEEQEDDVAPERAKPQEPEEPEVLQRGSRGDDVLELQQILHEHKYPVGKPDGIYGSGTSDAVKYLQYDLGKSETGTFNVSQIPWLKQHCPTYHIYVQMERGDNGIRVYDLQVRLKKLGYLSATPNGNFGSQTEAAVKLFEKAMSEKQTGVASAKVVQQIFSKGAVAAWDAFTDINNPSDPKPAPDDDRQAVSEDDLITMVRWMNNHIPGRSYNKKTAIHAVQSRLCELGFMKKSQRTSVYDHATVKAMKKFQDAYNPDDRPDGIPSTKTMELLLPSKLF